MRAIIFSHEDGGSVVMDRDGFFRRVTGYSAHPVGTEIELKAPSLVYLNLKRITAAAACFILLLAGVYCTFLWNTVDYYVYVDINPSVELSLNGFGKLRDPAPLDEDAERLCEDFAPVKEMDDAVIALIDAAARKGYFSGEDGASVLITVVSKNNKSPEVYLKALNLALAEHGMTGFAILDSCSMEFRIQAAEMGTSPGKLRLALTLIEKYDSKLTLEELLGMSVKELLAAIKAAENPIETAAPEETETTPHDPADEGEELPEEEGAEPEESAEEPPPLYTRPVVPPPPPPNDPPPAEPPAKKPPSNKPKPPVDPPVDPPPDPPVVETTVSAKVEDVGIDRFVVITITVTEDGETAAMYIASFAYINGTQSGTYIVEGDNGVSYTVYITYSGNEVVEAVITDINGG